MNPILKAGLAGLSAAIMIDLHAYQQTLDVNKNFDWKIAFTRYTMGFVLGCLTGAGIPQTQ